MDTSTQTSIATGTLDSVKKIRVGVIGVGNWAVYGPLRALQLLPQYEITAVYSQRPTAARDAATKYGIKHVAATMDELAARHDVDLVLVLTTGPQHEEALRAAITAGKDVYCEWPLTPRAESSAELVEQARAKGVRTILGTQRRFSPAYRYAKDLIADGYVGRVRSVTMNASVKTFGKTRLQGVRWSAFPENFMGVTSIFGAHMMDPLFSVVGRPTEISALSVNQWPEVTIAETGEKIATTVADQLLISGFLTSGAVFSVHIEGGKHNDTGVRIVVTGDDGDVSITNTAVFPGVGEESVVTGAKSDGTSMAVLPIPDSYKWQTAADLPVAVLETADLFEGHARDIASGTRSAAGFEDALFLQRLLDQAALSSATGRRLTVVN